MTRTGLVTDSNSQFPDDLAARYGVEIVPLTVTVDGTAYAEGTELSADDFYERFRSGTPQVATAAPSPGAFVDAYERAIAAGADQILSIHIGADVSGTLNAARVAAGIVEVPVRLVDTGTASFGVSCCVWEAAEVLAGGGTIDDAADVAERVAPSVANVFVVGALDIVRAGGRLASGTADSEAISVLSLVEGAITRIGEASDVDGAVEAMIAHIATGGDDLRVAVGVADTGANPLWRALEDAADAMDQVREVVRYRIGPSVGAHTGPGTAGAFFWPATS